MECPSPQARSITADFAVQGDTLRDRLVRLAGGGSGRMSFTDWCGNIIFATPTFRRTTSYGMLITEPLGPADAFTFIASSLCGRASGSLGRLLPHPWHARVRRYFIKEFLDSDARLGTKGLSYNPGGLLEPDEELVRYFDWLASVPGNPPETAGFCPVNGDQPQHSAK